MSWYEDILESEQQCNDHLVKAWNIFVALPEGHPDEREEFKKAIHELQGLLALRIADRTCPDLWRLKSVE